MFTSLLFMIDTIYHIKVIMVILEGSLKKISLLSLIFLKKTICNILRKIFFTTSVPYLME